jgi:hypothetical protein
MENFMQKGIFELKDKDFAQKSGKFRAKKEKFE